MPDSPSGGAMLSLRHDQERSALPQFIAFPPCAHDAIFAALLLYITYHHRARSLTLPPATREIRLRHYAVAGCRAYAQQYTDAIHAEPLLLFSEMRCREMPRAVRVRRLLPAHRLGCQARYFTPLLCRPVDKWRALDLASRL